MNAARICADCGGYDYEWMQKCKKHGCEFCRGCFCPYCIEEESMDEYEDLGLVDLEEQFDFALNAAFPVKPTKPPSGVI